VHISYSLIGLGFLQKYIPSLIQIIQYLGASYLVYIGYKTFIQKPMCFDENFTQLTLWQGFRQGLLTNSLNPKTTLFIMSIYSQIMTTNNSLPKLIGYGVFISGSHLAWFCLVALFCSTPLIRNKILARQICINRIIGCILSTLGIVLFFTHF
jgi:threonine/homoserine/homoserine lactone efflux protein